MSRKYVVVSLKINLRLVEIVYYRLISLSIAAVARKFTQLKNSPSPHNKEGLEFDEGYSCLNLRNRNN